MTWFVTVIAEPKLLVGSYAIEIVIEEDNLTEQQVLDFVKKYLQGRKVEVPFQDELHEINILHIKAKRKSH